MPTEGTTKPAKPRSRTRKTGGTPPADRHLGSVPPPNPPPSKSVIPPPAPFNFAPQEGREVVRSRVVLTKLGDGLSQAVKLDPIELHHGEEVTFLVRGRVKKVTFDEVADTECLSRDHVVIAKTVVIVENDFGAERVQQQAERLVKLGNPDAVPDAPIPGLDERVED